ncbi:Ig-like domain-containing protein [Aquabacterium humicola]|uniref:Ig-like domain-containing protein n=1 Tax=Aquabacterium humicola TaxID=3237377 RepID=UPI002542EBD7|nr:Ig-like domain-containing protein [Rubrivivax pictus]
MMIAQAGRHLTTWRTWFAAMLALLLVACGGGGSGGTPFVGPTNPQTVSSLVLVLSSPTIANSSTATVNATVTALDANNNAVANADVTVSADSNATVTVPGAKTGADGKLVAEIGIGSDRTPRTITITARSGSLTKTATLQVVEGNNGASDLTLSLSSSQLNNSGTQVVKATVVAVDGNRNTIAGIPVTLAVNNGATIKVSAAVTDADGKVSGDISIGEDKGNRPVVVTASSGTLSRTATLQITGAELKSTLLPAAIAVGQPGKVQYRLLDVSGNPITQRSITVTGPGGVQTPGTTNANGDYEYNYTAPAITGPLTIRASAAGVETVSTVQVQSGAVVIDPVQVTVQSASVSASPSVVPVNTATTNNQATVRALFLAANNAPVQNIRVRFDLDGDKQSIGGTFTSGSTMVYSDANGVATTAYVPGSRLSPTDGVTVRACWHTEDFAAGTCPHEAKTTLTVISQALSVTIGTNNLIEEDSTKLKFVKRYVVQVVDSSGLAAADVQVSATVDLLQYMKGFWTLGTERWNQVIKKTCDNEDLNRNGVAEVFSNGVVEDANNSFNLTNGRPALEPRKADVAVSFEGASRTNTSGSVVLRLEYPKNVASWVRFNLVIGAAGVAGTEGRANFVGDLPVPATEVNNTNAAPSFVESPYGLQESGVVMVRLPGSTGPEAALCTNPN